MKLPTWMSGKQAAAAPARLRRSVHADASAKPPSASQEPARQAPAAQAASAPQKMDSNERRALLYTALRDALSGVGVLPVDYKAKAVSVDRSGRQFLVMMDMGGEWDGGVQRLIQLEALVVQAAKVRADIVVTGVYWRIGSQAAPPLAPALPAPARLAPTLPADATRPVAKPHAVASPRMPAEPKQPLAARMREIFAPIDAGDVAAFKRAKARAAGERGLAAEDGDSG